MSPIVYIHTVRWSACSRKFITNFLEYINNYFICDKLLFMIFYCTRSNLFTRINFFTTQRICLLLNLFIIIKYQHHKLHKSKYFHIYRNVKCNFVITSSHLLLNLYLNILHFIDQIKIRTNF